MTTTDRSRTPKPVLTWAGIAMATALAAAACTGPGEDTTADPDSGGAAEEEDLSTQEEDTAGDGPEAGMLGDEVQPTVDCLVDAGAAPEDYTVEQFEADLFEQFQGSDVDIEAEEFDECLDLSEIEFESEDEG